MTTRTCSGSGQLTRVALREIRETAFRALVAVGASTGQADTASGQVLDAELHHGAGLRGLLDDLRLGPWRDEVVPVHDDVTELVVGADTATGLLRVGVHLVELASARPTSRPTISAAPLPLDPLLDDLLMQAAVQIGSPVCAATSLNKQRTVRVATPQGDLAWGDLAWGDPGLIVGPVPHAPTGRLTAFVAPVVDRTVGQWQLRESRDRHRCTAAQEGLHVDSAQWEAAYEAARAYLVPDA